MNEFLPATESELSQILVDNAQGEAGALLPVGGRTALNQGYPIEGPGLTISTSKLANVIDYPARDMTITVEAGTRIDELTGLLAAEGQQLPIDIPQAQRATLGGAIATDTSGPRRFGYGTFRDYVIGMAAVDASGRCFHAGGRVVKNVAGYDLCKLMVGSLGTLAIITQVTLKLRPLPESSALLWLTFPRLNDVDRVLERLLTSKARPIALDVLNPQAAAHIATRAHRDLPTDSPVLCIGIEGTPRSLDWQTQALEQEIAPLNPSDILKIPHEEAQPVWQALTEFPTKADGPLTFQVNLLPSGTIELIDRASELGVAVQSHAANGIVIGRLPDHAGDVKQAANILSPLRTLARSKKGNLTILNCEDQWKRDLPVFGHPEPAWPLMRQLKNQLDPHGLLNPGRFLDGAEKFGHFNP